MSFSEILRDSTIVVHECLERSPASAPHGARWTTRGLRRSCMALGDLAIDPQFFEFLRHTGEPRTLDEAREILSHLAESQHRLNEFLSAEQELLERAGLPSSVVAHLVGRCRQVFIERQYDDRRDLEIALAELRTFVCEAATRFEKSKRRGVLRGMRDVLGGLTIATLNGTLLAASVGITGGLSAASVAVGGIVAADGYSNVRELI